MIRLGYLNNSGAYSMSDSLRNDSVVMKNKKIFVAVLTGACLAMAMTMPSCPGQQAMQQQIDALQSSQQDMANKVRGLETQVKGANAGADEQKKIIADLTTAVAAQKTAIDNMNASIQQLDTKIATLSAPKSSRGAAKPAGKHKR
jgi:peptidoglycan hydrolase CwlO-like protein